MKAEDIFGVHIIKAIFERGYQPPSLLRKVIDVDGPLGAIEVSSELLKCPRGRFPVVRFVALKNGKGMVLELLSGGEKVECCLLGPGGPHKPERCCLMMRFPDKQVDYFIDISKK